MKIRSARLSNFRSYGDSTLDLDAPVVLLTGVNGAGKSTVADAISYALTGDCRGLHGRKADELLRQGAQMGGVRVVLDRQGKDVVIERAIGDGPKSKAQGLADAALGIPRDQVLACLSSSHILELPAKDRAALLVQIMGITGPTILEAFLAAGWEPGWGTAPDSLAGIDAAYDRVYAARREAKRVTGARAAAPAVPEVLRGHAPETADSAWAETSLFDGREVLAGLRRDREALLVAAPAPDNGRAGIEARLKSLREPVPPGKPEPKANAEKTLAEKAAKLAAEADEIRTTRAQLEEKIAALRAGSASYRDALPDLKKAHQLAQTKGKAGRCPTCAQEVSPVQVTAQFRHYETKVKAADDEIAGLARQLDGYADPADYFRRAQAAADEAVGCQELRDEWEEYRDACQALADEVAVLQSELDALPAPGAPPPPPDTAEVDARIARIEGAIAALHGYRAARLAWESGEQAYRDGAARVAVLERQVELLGPKGVRAQLVARHLEPFEERVDSVLRELGYRVAFDRQTLALTLGRADEEPAGFPIDMASGGQAMRAGLALAAAFSVACGLGFVVADNCEALDAEGQAGLLEIQRLAGLDQMIFAARSATDDVPEVDGVRVIGLRLLDGVTEVAGVGTAA